MEQLWYLIIGILFIGSLIKVFKPKIKGWFGEKSVAVVLSRLPQEHYRVIHNVMLKTQRGTTQIDHVIVSTYGIFVLETKNYKGWITGSDQASQWTKNMYGKKYHFQNPLKQNYGHVQALKDLLGIDEILFIPIVVFSPEADLKIQSNQIVVYTHRLKRTIELFQEPRFEAGQLERLSRQIIEANVDAKDVRKEHVQQIRQTVGQRERSVAQGICPNCGGALVERKGKYGTFTGCSKYPSCRFTVKK